MLLSPVVGAWTVMGRLNPDRHSLEHAVFVVERAYASKQGVTLTPADYGLRPHTKEFQEGHYRFGDDAALTICRRRSLPHHAPGGMSAPLDAHRRAQAGLVTDFGVGRLRGAVDPLLVVGALGSTREALPLWRGLGARRSVCSRWSSAASSGRSHVADYAPATPCPSLVIARMMVWAAGPTASVSVIGPMVARVFRVESCPADRPSRPLGSGSSASPSCWAPRRGAPRRGGGAGGPVARSAPWMDLRDTLHAEDVVVDATLSGGHGDVLGPGAD
ncbi:MAG: hypothetical protein IPI35_32705 [Deltaproteobacteria bacterium]|nr:hypothetical protein [Deltaproteobacteria bacterium]